MVVPNRKIWITTGVGWKSLWFSLFLFCRSLYVCRHVQMTMQVTRWSYDLCSTRRGIGVEYVHLLIDS